MSFNRPSISDLISRIGADVQSRLPGTDPKLRRSILDIMSKALAGAAHGLYGYLDFLSKQISPVTADTEFLERHAKTWGIYRKTASPAYGNVVCTGVDGTVIPQGSVLQRSDGTEFATDTDATISSGTVTVSVSGTSGGSETNTAAASSLEFVTPIADVNSTATVDANGLSGGVDVESDTDLRSRLLDRIQQPPQGGAKHDYIRWAKEVPGVTRAWCFPLENGAGTVVTRFMMDNAYTDGIPQTADVSAVQAYIDDRRPVGLAVNGFTAVAPVAVPLDFTLTVTPDTAAIRSAVEAELADLILRDAEPGGVIRISRINEAISLAAGETDHVLGSPSADVTHTANQIAVMGTVTWQ